MRKLKDIAKSLCKAIKELNKQEIAEIRALDQNNGCKLYPGISTDAENVLKELHYTKKMIRRFRFRLFTSLKKKDLSFYKKVQE